MEGILRLWYSAFVLYLLATGMDHCTGLVLSVSAQTQTPPTLSGDGTEDSPYLINTYQDLLEIDTDPNVFYYYRLTEDIDLSETSFSDSDTVVPVFSGVFDGNDHTINNLILSGDSQLGLFGTLTSSAIVMYLNVMDANIVGTGHYVGTIAGENAGGIIYGCESSGSVDANSFAGGITGLNNGSVYYCKSSSSVQGSSAIGGLVGWNALDIMLSYSTGEVSGTQEVGGLVGRNWYGDITSCYSTGQVTGTTSVGGLVGSDADETDALSSGVTYHSFWDTETSDQNSSAGGEGKTTVDMQSSDMYLTEGWDFTGETTNGTSEVWFIPEADSYPELSVLNNEPSALAGEGTWLSPFRIGDANALGAVYLRPLAYYELTGDIDLAQQHWQNGVIPLFLGTLNGNSYNIEHVTGTAGLSMRLNTRASILDLGLMDANIAGASEFVGALTAYNGGLVSHCFATGTVVGASPGGLIGFNDGTLSSSYGWIDVNGTSDVGGLVGINEGDIQNCFSLGPVDGNDGVGGLIGKNNEAALSVLNCYSAGTVTGLTDVGGLIGINDANDSVVQCFWDTEASRIEQSAGGMGQFTEAMQQRDIFLLAGWDFVGETNNGTADLWRMPDGFYPVSFNTELCVLTINANSSGQVIQPGEGVFHYLCGQSVIIKAEPNEENEFSHWSGTAVTMGLVAEPNQSKTTLDILDDATLQPNFVRTQYSVTFTSTEHGSIIEPDEGSHVYDSGTPIPITAVPDPDYFFSHWAVSDNLKIKTQEAETTLTIHGEGTVTAIFSDTETAYIPDPGLRQAIATALNSDIVSAQALAELTRLEARDANIEDLSGLDKAMHLTYLDLHHNDVNDINSLAALTKLTALALSQNQISDINALAGLVDLEELALQDNDINDISALAQLSRLERLNLSNNRISDVNSLASLTQCQVLWLNDNQITNVGPLTGLEQLVWLQLENNPLDPDTCNDLAILQDIVETQNHGRLTAPDSPCPP